MNPYVRRAFSYQQDQEAERLSAEKRELRKVNLSATRYPCRSRRGDTRLGARMPIRRGGDGNWTRASRLWQQAPTTSADTELRLRLTPCLRTGSSSGRSLRRP